MIAFEDVMKKIDFSIGPGASASVMVQYLLGVFSYSSSYFVSDAVNRGRFNAVDNIDGVDIAGAQWSAVLDSKTCGYCTDLDSGVILVDNPLYGIQQPPAHENCRCVYVYITAEEANLVEDWQEPSIEDIKQYKLYDIDTEAGQEYLSAYFGERAVRNATKFATAIDQEYVEEMWGFEGSPF